MTWQRPIRDKAEAPLSIVNAGRLPRRSQESTSPGSRKQREFHVTSAMGIWMRFRRGSVATCVVRSVDLASGR